MSSKKRSRKVTVEDDKIAVSDTASTSDKRKLSVFERLGPGAPRKYEGTEKLPEPVQSPQGICHRYQKYGRCDYGSKCRYQHPSHRDRSTEDFHRHHSDSEDNTPADMDKHGARQDKKDKIKSAVVVTKQSTLEETDSDPIPDCTDEDLQRRLSQLKQELSRLDQEERERERREKAGLTAISSDESDAEAPPVIIPQKHKKEKALGEHAKKKKEKKKKKKKMS